MNNKFSDVMPQHTDAELIKILNEHRNDYQPEAVEAAEVEFKKRNLSDFKIQEAKHLNDINNQINYEKGNKELETFWKVLTFIFPGNYSINNCRYI